MKHYSHKIFHRVLMSYEIPFYIKNVTRNKLIFLNRVVY
jgi:hypothetical protein